MHTGGCGRPSLPGKCQQENAYGQCLPKASKPELTIRRGHNCKVFVQPIFSLFSVQNPDICTPTENHDPSTVLDSVGISGSGISVVLHSWCFHHFLYNKTEFGSATASPEIARADPEIVDF